MKTNKTTLCRECGIRPETPGHTAPKAHGESARTKPSFTPGPWTQGAGGEVWKDGVLIAIAKGSGNDGMEMRGANARLIAAAPELLEAAQGAVNWIEGMGPFICEKASIRAALIGLRAAIAKAEGGR